MFSVNFVASAVLELETVMTSEITCLYKVCASVLDLVVSAPIILGIVEVENSLLPGSSLSGRISKKKIFIRFEA